MADAFSVPFILSCFEPIRARGIIVKYYWKDLDKIRKLTSCEGDTLKESEDLAPESREILRLYGEGTNLPPPYKRL